MEWTKQAETMMQTWTEAQKKVWEGWYDLMNNASNSSNTPFTFYPDAMKQWQQMMTQTLNAWTSGADPTAQNTARQLMATQEVMLRFLQTTTQAWQAIAPRVEAGEDWQSVVSQYGSQFFQTLLGTPMGVASAGKDVNELWQFYIQEWQKLSQPWLQTTMQSPTNLGHLMMGGGSELAHLTKFHWDMYERTIGGITEIPGLGSNRELNAKLMRGFDAYVDFQKVSAEYQTILSRTFGKAFERYMEKLVSFSEEGKTIDSIQDLMNLWLDTIDESFTRMYVSEEYLEAQKQLAAAGMTFKMRQQDILEVFLGMFDLPTRSELDDAYRSLNELRREVRALKKSLKEQGGAVAKSSKKKRQVSQQAEPVPA